MFSSSSTGAASGLAALEADLHEQLALLNYPATDWLPSRYGPDGNRLLSVAIVGAGQCGLAAAFCLRKLGISDIRIFDQASPGKAGPWLDYARMETLRSPKHLLGPACGIPALTFQAWYRAQWGEQAWQQLDKIPRPQWQQYLEWFRTVLGLEVEFATRVEQIEQAGEQLSLSLTHSNAGPEQLTARKVIFATGRDGLGKPSIPDVFSQVDKQYWAHSAEPIDFKQLAGQRVVVVGMGSSAMDNAATALEQGAKEVHLLARRASMPTINKLMGIGSPGFTHAFPRLSPEWRWRIMHYSGLTQTPAPHGSTLRVSRHDNACFHFNSAIDEIVQQDDALLVVTHNGRRYSVDFVIAATGFAVDIAARPELAGMQPNIARWRDMFTPPAGLESEGLGAFPWLGPGFEFSEREAGKTPALANVHAFNHGAALSHGKVSGDIPAISIGAQWLAEAIAADLYCADIEQHWQTLQEYSKPELDGSEWRDADV